MVHLHQHIGSRMDQWRAEGFACGEYPAIAEILEWAKETETGNLRFLRRPQLRALETYWYLRLIEKTRISSEKVFAASVKLTFDARLSQLYPCSRHGGGQDHPNRRDHRH